MSIRQMLVWINQFINQESSGSDELERNTAMPEAAEILYQFIAPVG